MFGVPVLAADFEVQRREFGLKLELRLEPGQRLAVLGRSGAGKTTLLEALAGLLPVTAGEIRLDGRRLSAPGSGSTVAPGRRGIGLLRQRPGLFPHLTVLENIEYARGSSRAAATTMASRLGLGRLLQSRPLGLSGGEAQRVALARTLQSSCRLLCLDEPFSSLDRPLAREFLDLLRQELQGSATAALLVTHQLAEAQAFADQLLVIDAGRVLQAGGGRELVLHPQTPVAAELVGYQGRLRRRGEEALVHPELARPLAPGDRREALRGRCLRVRPQGARFELELEAMEGWEGRFGCLADASISPGTEVSFGEEGLACFPAIIGGDAVA